MLSRRIGTVLLLICLSPGYSSGADSDSERAYERWVDYYRQIAHEYEIRLDGPRPAILDLRSDPVHVYQHPDGAGLKEHLGAMFVWHRGGRPEAIGAIWSYPLGGPGQRNIVHEFQSLSDSPLTAHRDGGLDWSPDEAGIEPARIPDAPVPAGTRALRLAQMRLLSRRFTAVNHFEEHRDLRLATHPLHRQEDANEGAKPLDPAPFDGAVFVYFMDWDPELFLLIEARRDAAGPAWYYAAARFSDKRLTLRREGVDVWTAPALSHVNHACGGVNEPFYAVHGVDQHELDLEPETGAPQKR